jgi:phenylacetic acid degradation operon negative regulatory protein
MVMDRYLSTITSAPVSYSVYSSLSFFGPHVGGELPGTWFVAALGRVGHDTAAVRQTLWRMERSGELAGRAEGRQRFYRFTPLAQAEASLGLARIMEPAPGAWNREWTLVHLRFGAKRRTERERVVAALHTGGFRSPGPGVFLHPRARVSDIRAIVEAGGSRRMTVLRGRREGGPSDADFVRELWDPEGLALRYRRFLDEWSGDERRRHWSMEDAFAARFALVLSYLDVAWNDPDLPRALLPQRWPGARARRLARGLYRRLQPGALRVCQGLLHRSLKAVPA